MAEPTPELKPCPFCGGSATIGGLVPWAECNACAATGEACTDEASAVAAWNRRAAPQPPAEAQPDRMAIKMLVAAGYVTEAKANEAMRIAHGFDKGPLSPAEAQAQGGGEWRPMATAPRDGTMVRLLVDFDDHPTDDTSGHAPTIGACNDDNVPEDQWVGWQFSGWCWSHDHFTEGKGTPVGWLPMLDTAPPSAPVGLEGLAAALHEARERMIAALAPKFGEAFDGDFDTMREAADALAQQPADDDSTDYDCPDCGKINYKPLGCDNCGYELPGPAQQPAPVAPVGVTDEMVAAACLAYVRDPKNDAERERPGTFYDPSEYLQWHLRRMPAHRFAQFMRSALERALAQQPAAPDISSGLCEDSSGRKQPTAADSDDVDCSHSALDGCDCYAGQHGGDS